MSDDAIVYGRSSRLRRWARRKIREAFRERSYRPKLNAVRLALDALTTFGIAMLILGILNMAAGHGIDLIAVAWVALLPDGLLLLAWVGRER